MAKNGKDFLWFIREEGEEDWMVVSCLTTNGFEGSRDDIDTSSKCDGDWGSSLSGTGSWTMSGDGNAIDSELNPSQVSYDKLFDLFVSGEIFETKLAEVGGTYVRYGKGRISSHSETQANNAPFTFSTSVQGIGAPSKTEPVTP